MSPKKRQAKSKISYASLVMSTLTGALFTLAPAYSQDQIDLGAPPEPMAAPSESTGAVRQRLRKRIDRRQEREKEQVSEQRELVKEQEKLNETKKLEEETKKTRNYSQMAQVSFVLPTVVTLTHRSRYKAEPSSQFLYLWRLSSAYEANKWQSWLGMQLGAFSGTGRYRDAVGRYGFTYVGPIIGAVKLGEQLEATEPGRQAEAEGSAETRRAWLFLAGVSMQNRKGQIDGSSSTPDQDLDTTRGVKLDGPGVWMQAVYGTIKYGVVGTHYVAGMQVGQEKAFFWLGIGLGAWY